MSEFPQDTPRPSPKEEAPRSRRPIVLFRRRGLLPLAVLVLAAVLALGLWTARSRNAVSSRTVEFGLRSIGELATQAGYFTNVQTISGSRSIFGVTVPFTQSRYIYSYDGIVKAGIDFTQAAVQVDGTEKVITVTLPPVRILSVTVDEDSLVVYDETKNIFNPLKLGDVNASMIAMKAEVERTAIENGILENARDSAELLITGFLRGAYPDTAYAIRFDWQEEGKETA